MKKRGWIKLLEGTKPRSREPDQDTPLPREPTSSERLAAPEKAGNRIPVSDISYQREQEPQKRPAAYDAAGHLNRNAPDLQEAGGVSFASELVLTTLWSDVEVVCEVDPDTGSHFNFFVALQIVEPATYRVPRVCPHIVSEVARCIYHIA